MLLKLIDFTAENAAQCLQKFRSLKTLTTKEHKKTIPALVRYNLLLCHRNLKLHRSYNSNLFLQTSCMWSMRPAGCNITLHFSRMFVCPHLSCVQ